MCKTTIMVRLLFVFCILLVCYDISGQGVAVKKSGDVVVIKGKSYYIHTVMAGQTLYSICKAYDVDVDAVKDLNEKKDNTLSLHEVLRIPYTEPFVQQDGKYFYHKLAKGETLYSVSRKFDIKVKRILKSNPEYDGDVPLPIGAVVRLPLGEINMIAVRAEKAGQPEKEIVSTPAKTIVPATVKEDKKARDKKDEKVSVENVVVREQGVKQEVVAEPETPVHQEYVNTEPVRPEVPEYLTEVVMTDKPYVKIALLLPLYAKDYSQLPDTLNVKSYKSISARSEQFVYFYEGILLAVDSLKNKGYDIDLQVFDTERDAEKVRSITEKLNRMNPDLIIGPVYGSAFKAMADNLENRNIPIIYPLSSRSEDFGKYPNFVQVNATFETLADGMADWIALQSANANIISVNLSKDGSSDEQALSDMAEKKIFVNKIHQMKGINFFKWNFMEEPIAALKHLLLPDRENIIILPTTKEADVSKILPALSVYADRYKITVVGFPEWQTFTSVDHETYFKLNVKFFSYSYVDISTAAAKSFAEKYRTYFYTEPNNLSNKAYDIGLYFIDLAARYRDRTLDAIEYYGGEGAFSRFDFSKFPDGAGKENRGLYIVTYGSDYQLRVERVK